MRPSKKGRSGGRMPKTMVTIVVMVSLLLVCVAVNGARPAPSNRRAGSEQRQHTPQVQQRPTRKGAFRPRSLSPVRVAADHGDWIIEESVPHNKHRDRILYRSHRQAEDSYEDGGDYEYEEEGEGGNGNGNGNSNKEEGEGEEYYDNYEEGGNGNGNGGGGGDDGGDSGGGSSSRKEEDEGDDEEEERAPVTTTTTTTTERPYIDEPEEEDMDSEQYEEERYDAERRRYEAIANAGAFYPTEEPPPPPPPPPSTQETTAENSEDAEEVEEEERREPTTTPPPPPPPPPPPVESVEEPRYTESERDQYEETSRGKPSEEEEEGEEEREEQPATPPPTSPRPPPPEEPPRREETEEDTGTEEEERGRGRSQEIVESGREDLERYTVQGGRNEEELEEEEGEDSRGRPSEPSGASVESRKEPERVEEPAETEEEEEEKVPVETTTIPPPPPTTTPGRSQYIEEHELEEEEEEIDEYEEHSIKTEPTSTTSTTTYTINAAPTTLPTTTQRTTQPTTTSAPKKERPRYHHADGKEHDPDPYDESEEEEEEEDDEEDEDSYYRRKPVPQPTSTTTTSTTSTTTAEPPLRQVVDSLEEEEGEERVHGLGSLEEQNRHRYQFEHTTSPPAITTTTPRYELPVAASEENEVDIGRYDTEEELLAKYTTTPPPPPPPPPPSREPEVSEEEVRRPFHVEIIDTADSSENRIFHAKSEEIEEEEEEIRQVNTIVAQPERPVAPPSEEDDEERRRTELENPTKIECFEGYALSPDGTECLDIDECAQGVCGSTQICVNRPGSYVCSCPSGFVKDFRNPKNCRDLNECEEGSAGCSQDCINTLGGFYCSCSDTYRLDSDGKTCVLKPTTTTTTTPPPTTPALPTTTLPASAPRRPILTEDGGKIRSCPTPPVPRGAGIAYLYCSRSPVGIHHRHSQLERRLLQDWAARKNRTGGAGGARHPNKFRHRRNLRRKLRQTTYAPGSMCELRCRPGFELKGQYTLQCNSSLGIWQGPRDGYCGPIPRTAGSGDAILNITETASPSNEIPRLPGNNLNQNNEISSGGTDGLSGGLAAGGGNANQFRPSFVPPSNAGGSRFPTPTFRPTFNYQRPPPANTTPRPSSTTSQTTPIPTIFPPSSPTTTQRTAPPLLITPPPPASWPGSSGGVAPSSANRQPPYYGYNNYYYTPSSSARPPYPQPSSTVATLTSTLPTTTTSRNSYIHLTYRFKEPWIKCPDDMKVDLGPNQNQAYVIIPQPQTNVDWWRQVTSEPAWAKGLETEIGPGKTRITFRARTSAPSNNSAECSFFLEVVDNEPPRVRECPESFSTRLAPGQSSRSVTWIEPQFTDNVRIVTVKKSHEPGVIMPLGEHFVNYEAKDSSDNKAKCSFTVTVLPPAASNGRKPVNTDTNVGPSGGPTQSTPVASTTFTTPVQASLRNVVCHVGKKGRRIVFLSRVVPRGCSEMTVDVAGDSGPGGVNTINTVTQGSAENSATSQISSVSFSSHDHPQSAGAFSQAISNGRNNNRLVHSTSSVTSGQQGTTSRASSYAVAISSSSRNFDLPFINPAAIDLGGAPANNRGDNPQDKQIYDDEFIVPSELPQVKSRAPPPSSSSRRSGNGNNRPYYQRPAPSLVISSPSSSTTTTASTPTYVVPRPAPTLVVGNINNNNNNNGHRDYYNNYSNNSNLNYQQHPNYTNNPHNFPTDENGAINKNSSDYRKYFRHFDSWGHN